MKAFFIVITIALFAAGPLTTKPTLPNFTQAQQHQHEAVVLASLR